MEQCICGHDENEHYPNDGECKADNCWCLFFESINEELDALTKHPYEP